MKRIFTILICIVAGGLIGNVIAHTRPAALVALILVSLVGIVILKRRS